MPQTGLTWLDFAVLIGYFVLMALIGFLSMFMVRKQEDFFMGSRSFGKMLQMFAAFGAGTNASEPIVTAKTSFVSGLSGIWSSLLWLFVTPFYWITGVWYRRMRVLTLGDWFAERYQSKSIALAYVLFGIVFYIVYLGTGMTAIGKMGGPLTGSDSITLLGWTVSFEKFFIIVTAVTVLIYGVLGGLRAAYWTDLIQGVFIIILSVILIPVGLNALVKDHQATMKAHQPAAVTGEISGQSKAEQLSTIDGFTILHERVPKEYFQIATSPKGGEFPIHYILAITLLNLFGIACQPHFIATGGGSAKSEYNARFGLVSGNLLKRFCTIGWALTALIALAYLAGNVEIAEDPDRVWGVATRELLGPLQCGLVGLMLACLLAALMSSASCYMIVVSGLVVRNAYAAYVNPNASERTYVFIGRICSAIVIIGATLFSLNSMNVFSQLKFAWELPILFAAPFWIGIFWRKANKYAVWMTMVISLFLFFLIPMNIARFKPEMVSAPGYWATNDFVVTREYRTAAIIDIQRREATIALWNRRADQAAAELTGKTPGKYESLADSHKATVIERLGNTPAPLTLGAEVIDDYKTGGKAIFWNGGVTPLDSQGTPLVFDEITGKVTHCLVDGKKVKFEGNLSLFDPAATVTEQISPTRERLTHRFRSPDSLAADGVTFRGKGTFELDFLLYQNLGMKFEKMSNGTLESLRLPTRLAFPFICLILISLITPAPKKELLDRYYVKMKTPVDADPEKDKRQMELSYANPQRFEHKRLFRFWGLEFNKPTFVDVAGFVVSFLICFGIIGLILAIANYQP